MLRQFAICFIVSSFLTVVTGCNTFNKSVQSVDDHIRSSVSATYQSCKRIVSTNASNDRQDYTWNWKGAIPVLDLRASELDAKIKSDEFENIVNVNGGEKIFYASTSNVTPYIQLSRVNGIAVKDYGNLIRSMDSVGADASGSMTVKTEIIEPTKNHYVAIGNEIEDRKEIELTVSDLAIIAHSIQPNHSVLSVPLDGNQWVILKYGGLSCKLLVRSERNTGLIQLVVSSCVHWGPEMRFPYDVQIKCNDVPADCLSVSDTLGQLYGKTSSIKKETKSIEKTMWMKRSAEADFVIPSNYDWLSEQMAGEEKSRLKRIKSAFAELPGVGYPGPAVLGDARALSMFYLTPENLVAGEGYTTGWAVFQSDEAKNKSKLTVTIWFNDRDFQSVEFILPAKK